jgi:hypothetical protein
MAACPAHTIKIAVLIRVLALRAYAAVGPIPRSVLEKVEPLLATILRWLAVRATKLAQSMARSLAVATI